MAFSTPKTFEGWAFAGLAFGVLIVWMRACAVPGKEANGWMVAGFAPEVKTGGFGVEIFRTVGIAGTVVGAKNVDAFGG